MIYVRNGETGQSGYFDFYPNGKTSVVGKVDQKRLDHHARLTIKTTPKQEQKMLDAMNAKKNDPPKYEVDFGKVVTHSESTCVTQSESILSAGGLSISGQTPTEVWQNAYSQFSGEGLDWKDQTTAGFQQNPFFNPGTPPQGPGYDDPQPGQEYGRDPSASTGKVDPNANKNEDIQRKDKPN